MSHERILSVSVGTETNRLRRGFRSREVRRLPKEGKNPILTADQARDRIMGYLGRQETRMDLESQDIKDLLGGIKRFKEYNVHEQIEGDPHGTGAIGLGEGKFRVPNHNRYRFLFLHDLYFMSKGDQDTPEGRELIESALDKLVHLYNTEGIFPQYNARSGLIASAAPLFLPTVWEWYQNHPDKDSEAVKEKLRGYIKVGAQEHDHNWNNTNDLTGAIGTNHHVVPGYKWLRSAGDKDCGDNYQASRELRMDRTHARFGGAEASYLPIDIEVMLLQGKRILIEAAEVLDVDKLGNRTTEQRRQDSAEMETEINEQMFDPITRNYYDRNHKKNKLSPVQSIAAAWAFWGGLSEGDDALVGIGHLTRLDSGHGLLVTTVEDIPQPVSDKAKASIGLHPIQFEKIDQISGPANWDGKVFPPEQIATTEGVLENYIKRGDKKGLDLKARLAITRFFISKVHEQVATQVHIFKNTRKADDPLSGKFSEKWRPDGEDDNGTFHYEPQKDGLGWGATLAELNVTKFLPQLYAWEDKLVTLVDSGQAEAEDVLTQAGISTGDFLPPTPRIQIFTAE